MKFSKYQNDIFDFAKNGKGHCVVNAVAGSGKTTTLVELANRLHGSVLFLAFNKHVVSELKSRMRGSVNCKTIHSLGFSMLRNGSKRTKVNNFKYHDILDKMFLYRDTSGRITPDMLKGDRDELNRRVIQVINMARLTLTNIENVNDYEDMVLHYGIIANGIERELAVRALEVGLLQFDSPSGILDYADMLYLPIIKNLTPRFKHNYVLVDECQDLSNAQLAVVKKSLAPGGRFFFVGDRNQAIMGFAGANCDSVDNIVADTKATELPLSICYRCPKKSIELAKALVPHIEARPDAPDGIESHIRLYDLFTYVGDGDLIISRVTAPLIKICLSLIAKGIPAKVRGRDIGKGLKSVISSVGKMKKFHFGAFHKFLRDWCEREDVKINKREHPESALESLYDKVACIEAIFDSCPDANCLGDLLGMVDVIFDDNRATIYLSTIHRAKGLEADNVFIVYPEKLPLKWSGQLPWQYKQELHLEYVAKTRNKKAIYFCETPTIGY